MRLSGTILEGFVVLEGIDGSGTTTQLRRLAASLAAAKIPSHAGFEPSDSAIGRLIRSVLRGECEVHPLTMAHLFAADRSEHVYGKDGILERTSRGELVVSDRYLFSSLAYQGLTCGPEVPGAINAFFPLPELLVFLDLPAKTALERVDLRGGREIYEHASFQEKVAESYRGTIARAKASTPMRVLTLDGTLPPDGLADRIWLETEPLRARLAAAARPR